MKKFSFYHSFLASLLMLGLILTGCTVPQYIWPQKDTSFFEMNKNAPEKKLLIASRSSEFKNAVIEKLKAHYRDSNVYVKIIGIEYLKDENASQYQAIVLINTAMAWVLDRKVEAFLDQNPNLDSIIVLTTSGGGDVLPDTDDRKIDAIACASYPENIDKVSDEIIAKLDKLLN